MVIACNTAHLLLPELQARRKLPFVSLVDVTVKAAKAKHVSTVGLLASPTTIKTKLYAQALEREGIEVLIAGQSEQMVVEGTIRSVIAGKDPIFLTKGLLGIVRHMQSRGAEAIILGCTELSVVFAGGHDETIIDPLDEVTTELLGASHE